MKKTITTSVMIAALFSGALGFISSAHASTSQTKVKSVASSTKSSVTTTKSAKATSKPLTNLRAESKGNSSAANHNTLPVVKPTHTPPPPVVEKPKIPPITTENRDFHFPPVPIFLWWWCEHRPPAYPPTSPVNTQLGHFDIHHHWIFCRPIHGHR